jgi:hypothetical protein
MPTPKPEEFFKSLKSKQTPRIAKPDESLNDKLVQAIFDQANEHRRKLINFFITYTSILSGLVMLIVFWQAGARFFVYGDKDVELIPQWALNLIVVGMFGQFIGLLAIVTKRVWEYKPFLDHVKNSPN